MKRPEGRAPGARHLGNRLAFTLMELLVAVAIIGILAALILATISRAKGYAKRTQCVSNERQLGIALQAFVAENHAYPLYVNVGFANGERPEHWRNWIEALSRESLGANSNGVRITEVGVRINEGVWRCPSAPFGVVTWASYGYNAYGNAYGSPPDYGSPQEARGLGGSQLPSASGALGLGSPIAENEVVNPADMMAIGEDFRSFDQFTPMPSSMFPHASLRHQGKVNVLFCDGHVESPTLAFVFGETNNAALSRWNRDHQP